MIIFDTNEGVAALIANILPVIPFAQTLNIWQTEISALHMRQNYELSSK